MQLKFYPLIMALSATVLLAASCQSDKKTDPMESDATAKPITVPAFNRDSAYAFVARQVAFGPRVTNSPAHAECRKWLVDQFKAYGATVIEQNFQAKAYTGVMLNGTNIIAQYNPGNKNRIVLSSHWDSRPFADSPLSKERRDEPILGADDGASGVGVLLEIARVLQANPTEFGVDLVLFDAEDFGESKEQYANEEEERRGLLSWGLGSQHWSANLHASGYRPKYGILLDMVGAKGARFTHEAFSMRFAPETVNKVWTLAINMGYGNYFIAEDGGGVTDDHYFVNTIAGIPMIDIINRPLKSETGFGHYWHTHEDNMDVIDRQTLRAVGQVLLAVIYREAGNTL
jgi:acetylornithine deacetylase/succinyl-diaminopimelate desuccinylase-like protein